MAKTVCLLNEQEAVVLRSGRRVDCRKHQHIDRLSARLMVLGGEKLPWHNFESFKPIARWALLPNGAFSQKHIIQQEAHEWRKVTTRQPYGGLGFAVMQLVSQAKSS